MAVDEYGLTPKQRAFADYYIECGSATRAARKAGYKDAKTSGCKNTGKYAIKAYIDAKMQPTAEKRIATAEQVCEFLTRVMLGEEKDQFGLDASLQDRIKAGQELLKRYAVADQQQASTMARLDAMMAVFRQAVDASSGAVLPAGEPEGSGESGEHAGGSSPACSEDT